MHKNNLLKLYKHVPSGEFLRLVILRKSGVNTYLQVDCNNNPIVRKREWSIHKVTQSRIVKGFENLEIISYDNI